APRGGRMARRADASVWFAGGGAVGVGGGARGMLEEMRAVTVGRGGMKTPRPPIWIPGAGSLETMEYVAKRRWAYMGIPYFHKRVFKRNFDFFDEACAKEGYTARPDQKGWLVPVY